MPSSFRFPLTWVWKLFLLSCLLLPYGLHAQETSFEFGGPVWMFKPTVPFTSLHGVLKFAAPEEDCNLIFRVFKHGELSRWFPAWPGGFQDHHIDAMAVSVNISPVDEPSSAGPDVRLRYQFATTILEPRGYSGTFTQPHYLLGDEFDHTEPYHTGRFAHPDFTQDTVPLFYIVSSRGNKGPLVDAQSPEHVLSRYPDSPVIICYLQRKASDLDSVEEPHPPAPPVVPDKEKHLNADAYLGRKAPDLKVQEWLTPEPDTKGKFILVDFWATWCGPCLRAVKDLNVYQEKFKDKLVVIGLSDDTREKVEKLGKRKPLYALASDSKNETATAIHIKGIPHVMLIDPAGIVRWEGFPAQPGFELTEQVIADLIRRYEAPADASAVPPAP